MLQNILLGAGLAVDASAVSMTNGLTHPKMKVSKVLFIGFLFGLFQTIMPLIGYLIGSVFEDLIANLTPWIALILLGFIGGKMLIDGFKKDQEVKESALDLKELLIEGIATSIDALTVGIIYIGQSFMDAFLAFITFGIVTFIMCIIAVYVGKKFGTLFEKKAQIVGGLILIIIGLKTFIEYLITII